MEKLTKEFLSEISGRAEELMAQDRARRRLDEFNTFLAACNQQLREAANRGRYVVTVSERFEEREDLEKLLRDHYGDLLVTFAVDQGVTVLTFKWKSKRSQ